MLSEKPVTSVDEAVAVQVKSVLAMFDVSVTFGLAPLQIAVDGGELERSGTGYTVTI